MFNKRIIYKAVHGVKGSIRVPNRSRASNSNGETLLPPRGPIGKGGKNVPGSRDKEAKGKETTLQKL